MILIACPYCGERNSSELRYVGERKSRPDPSTTSEEAWRDYLYNHSNPSGWVTEQWFHRAGCRKYFLAERHTLTNEVRSTWPIGQDR